MKISIITICFNEAPRIEGTIKSVLNQTARAAIEYIVIDGGSSDGTAEIIGKYKDALEYFVSEADNGIYHAMNKGAEAATGDYFLFLNGGDRLVGAQVIQDFRREKPRAGIVYGHTITEDGRIMKDLRNVYLREYLRHATLPHQASFIRRNLFRRVGGHDTSYKIGGDYDFFVRAVFHHRASTRYYGQAIAVFDLGGLSNREVELMEQEKKRVQQMLPPRSVIDRAMMLYRIWKRRVVRSLGDRRSKLRA